ncbi:MAG TPA: hypothetical protein VF824_05245 [Thermoanaerobaculia bacterium]
MKNRLGVFLAALIPRAIVAYVTFGAVDAVHNFRNFLLLTGGRDIVTPYLPGIELLLWIEGLLGYAAPLPVMFAWKLAPLLCDALIALLLYDMAPDAKSGLRRGLLYAIAPVPIYVCSIHSQWDSLFLYPLLLALSLVDLKRRRKSMIAGIAFVVSLIFKPIAAPLILLLIPKTRERIVAFVTGAAGAMVAYAAILYFTGTWPSVYRLLGVVQYAAGGVQVFGLAFRPHDRLIAVAGAIAVAAFVYFRGRCTRAEGMLIFLAITLGLSGLSVQYLCWILPFAILCERWIFVTLYGLAAGFFCVYYYQSPYVNLLNIDHLGAYGLLHPLGRFGPPLPPRAIRPLLQLDGNLIIPLLLLGFAAFRVTAMLARDERARDEPIEPHLSPALAFVVLIAIGATWAALQPRVDPDTYVVRVEQKIGAYDVVRYRGRSGAPGTKLWLARSLLEPGVANPIVNATNIALAAVTAAAAMAFLYHFRRS